ncbi:polyubiquitin-like [Protopterus annectens]|uniref:polyubiquitin-like n=1 Tax=Protopterus annectens TaxID=7888 RepID=UPI001CF9626E|nr:polyubiquitin-like [Protopterus annectens]
MGKKYQLIVLGLRQERIVLDVADSDHEFKKMNVQQVKEKLSERIPGCPRTEDFRLIFADKQLNDNQKLSECGIKNKSSVMMVLRLPGGINKSVLFDSKPSER